MKLGIVGPLDIVEKIKQIIQREFHQIEPKVYIYNTFIDIPRLIDHDQPLLDAILFAGETLYSYTEKRIKPIVPWEFIPRNGSSLLQVLLKIALSQKCSIDRISSDLYDENILLETYKELGIKEDQYQIFTINKQPFEDDFIDSVCSFHEYHYLNNHVTCCITALHNVYERLAQKNIPCFRVDPTANVIRQTVNKMQLYHLMQISQESRIVAISIRIDSPSEYSVFTDDEYQYIIDKTNVARHIYLFAKRVQAAVVEVGKQDFLLFSTKRILENATNNFENIDLLLTVKKNTSSTVSIGVGYGLTAQEAKYSAILGMEKASKLGGDSAFIVYNHNKIIGPLHSGDSKWQVNPDQKIDKKFLIVSEKSGISINTVFHLYGIIEQEGKTRFTTAELAALAGVTVRTMNRLLTKLERHGFCFEVGKRVVTGAGRPSRIVEIIIP